MCNRQECVPSVQLVQLGRHWKLWILRRRLRAARRMTVVAAGISTAGRNLALDGLRFLSAAEMTDRADHGAAFHAPGWLRAPGWFRAMKVCLTPFRAIRVARSAP